MYLKLVECSGPQWAVTVALLVETILRPHSEVFHRAVVEGELGVHHLVGWPGGILLDLVPGRQELVIPRDLGVVLGHDDGVAQHLPVLVTEVVLPEPDGDGVHRS